MAAARFGQAAAIAGLAAVFGFGGVGCVFLPGGWANSLRSAGRGDDAGRLAGFGWRARWAQRLRFNFGRFSVVALAAGVVARAWFFTVFSGYGGHFVYSALVASAGTWSFAQC